MWYFDKADTGWIINVTIKDNAGNSGENSSTEFQYNTLTAMKMSPTSLEWDEINLTDINTTANDPILINNTGNEEPLNINVTALDLQGEQYPSYYIFAANFTVENATGGCSGTTMSNDTSINVTSAILYRGNHSLNYNNATSGQEQLFFCLKEIPSENPAQSYSSAFGAWEIRILLVAVIPVARRRKKKLKKSNKILKLLIELTDELRKEYSKEKETIINQLIKAVQKEYKVSRSDVLSLIRKEIEIPIEVFSKELGALESIVKYMKENLNMNYKGIASELKRDQRTIWTAYKKASEKMKKPLEIKETKMFLSLSVFKDRKLTILESIIVYLREKGLRYSEIAELVNRDQRNIWTIYSKTIKKQRKILK
jgi:DNA-directed RNA polymerase specialized sigma24 family protein